MELDEVRHGTLTYLKRINERIEKRSEDLSRALGDADKYGMFSDEYNLIYEAVYEMYGIKQTDDVLDETLFNFLHGDGSIEELESEAVKCLQRTNA